MELTTSSKTYIGTRAVGYMVNTPLDEESASTVGKLQASVTAQHGTRVWATPREALHITLLDWLAPLVDYGQDKDALFHEIFPVYDRALRAALEGVEHISVRFNRLLITESAIALVGDAACTDLYNRIRRSFLNTVSLLPNTKQPPTIVHSSILRYMDSLPLDDMKAHLGTYSVDISAHVSSFRLVRESTLPMLAFELQKAYMLEEVS